MTGELVSVGLDTQLTSATPGTQLARRGLDDVQLHLVDDFETATELMRWLGSRDAERLIAVDTETTGLIIGKDKIRLVQVGGHEHGWAIPWNLWGGLFHNIVQRYTGQYVFHNAPFDVGMLGAQGAESVSMPLHRIHDTLVMSHIVEPHMLHGLKRQAGRHVDAAAAGAQATLDKAINSRSGGWGWDTIPIDYAPYWQYAALDTVLTRHLFDVHAPVVQWQAPIAYELEMAVLWVLYRMSRRGVHVDVDYAKQKYDSFMSYVETASAWIQENYKVKPGSNAAIIKILQGEGFIFDKKTESGAFSLDKEVLGFIDHPLAATVLNYRQLQKLSSTYLRHFIEEADADSLLYPSINSLGARTGRMSMQNPNFQNLPRRSEQNRGAEAVRNCIDARPGNSLLFCDFGQIEMRLLAHMSRCQPMIDAFRNTEHDFFVTLARQIFADPNLGRKDKRRQITKNAGYATIYGAGIPKFAKTAGVSEEDAHTFFSRWNGLYPEVKSFQKEVDRLAWQRQRDEGVPYVSSPLTGRRHVGDTNKVYALVNYLIQGTASETFKTKLVQLDALGLGAFMTIPVHDEIILDVPDAQLSDVVNSVSSVMNDDTMYSVPITASMAHGKRWGMKVDWIGDMDALVSD
ncbi:MAG: hypothetical protein A2Y75_05205 [Candidatus Solincola sediminis]|uniref:DNA polymerase I n=1 Tax=Candidatus Solincola sediminis TaxID=1797199 RepID=A0A1F2WG44_9ACTN|nr:MAG: hypothetical protein A2Y75_05205 [Candidatus Solincola sediminis]